MSEKTNNGSVQASPSPPSVYSPAANRMSRLTLLREKSFAPTSAVNPFVESSMNHSKYNQVKSVLLFPLFLIRLFLCLAICLVCVFFCRLLLINFPRPPRVNNSGELEPEPKMGRVRRKLINLVVRSCCRAFLLVMGFYWISVKGRRDSTCKLMIANHTTMVDVVILLYVCAPSFLSKSSVLQVPLIGTICRAMQVIGVDRFNPGDKSLTKQKMQNYLDHATTNPLLVFPEGTTTRYDTLMRFKPGAFDFGAERIQPILLHWRFKHYDPSSTATSKVPVWLYHMLTQFVHHVEVEYLPALVPQREEMNNALFFAQNAHKVVLRALQRRASSTTARRCLDVDLTGFEHDVHGVSCNVDDFLVWKWFLRANIPEIKYTLLTYSMQSIRDVLGLVTPLMEDKIDLTIMLQVAERYARVWHSSMLPNEHVNKSLLSFLDISSCVLKEQAGTSARETFLSAFSEACLFQTNLPTSTTACSRSFVNCDFSVDKFDFRQFATAMIWLSPTRLVWGEKYQILDEPYCTDAGVHKWVSVRARICFAYICSHQALRDDVSRADIAHIWHEEGLRVWDAAFESPVVVASALSPAAGEDEVAGGGGTGSDARASVANEESSAPVRRRFNAAEFREEIVSCMLLQNQGGGVEGEEKQARRAKQLACVDFLDYVFAKIDGDFTQHYYSGGSFFLCDTDVHHRQVSEHDVDGSEEEEEEDGNKFIAEDKGSDKLITHEEQV